MALLYINLYLARAESPREQTVHANQASRQAASLLEATLGESNSLTRSPLFLIFMELAKIEKEEKRVIISMNHPSRSCFISSVGLSAAVHHCAIGGGSSLFVANRPKESRWHLIGDTGSEPECRGGFRCIKDTRAHGQWMMITYLIPWFLTALDFLKWIVVVLLNCLDFVIICLPYLLPNLIGTYFTINHQSADCGNDSSLKFWAIFFFVFFIIWKLILYFIWMRLWEELYKCNLQAYYRLAFFLTNKIW